MTFYSINPFTEEQFAVWPTISDDEVDARVERLWQTWQRMGSVPLAERVSWLERLADLLDQRRAECAEIMTREVGKTIGESLSEVLKCAATARYYAQHGPAMLTPSLIETEARLCEVSHASVGPVLAVMPWNYPFWQVLRFFIPTLLLGNTAAIKHAENVQGSSELLCSIVREATGGRDVLLNLPITLDQVGRLYQDRRIRAVTFTGSVRGGREVGAAAGRAGKKVVLELGGSDPFIIMADADVDAAIAGAVQGRFANNGQSCVAAKRFLVARPVLARFVAGFAAKAEALAMGDPLAAGIALGPLARRDIRDGLAEQVGRAIAAGATPVLGGTSPNRKGYFYPPTILLTETLNAPVFAEEFFGPVAIVCPFDDPDQAVALANATDFGLGLSIWSRDTEMASVLADRIEAGAVFINDTVRSDPRFPIGGVKASGHGRELGDFGMYEFANVRVKWIAR